MKTITFTQTFQVNIPAELRDSSKEEILNWINLAYDVHGKKIITHLDDEEYLHTTLSEIDDENVYLDDNKVSNQGSLIILDGSTIGGHIKWDYQL